MTQLIVDCYINSVVDTAQVAFGETRCERER